VGGIAPGWFVDMAAGDLEVFEFKQLIGGKMVAEEGQSLVQTVPFRSA
jgi:hypothetical protein